MSGGATERMADFDLTPEQRLVRRTRARLRRARDPALRRGARARGALSPRADREARAAGLPGADDPRGVRRLLQRRRPATGSSARSSRASTGWWPRSSRSPTRWSRARSCAAAARRRSSAGCPAIARGEILCSACLTEPGRRHRSREHAHQRRRRWTAASASPGSKVFISHAAHAGLFFVVATVDRARQHAGVTALLVDPKSPGIRIGAFPMRTLQRDHLAEVHFEDVFVPAEGLLGRAGGGFPVLGSALDMGRYSVAARCVGQAQRCIDLSVGLRHAARGLRPEDRRVPDDPAEDCRHGLPHRGRARDRLPARAHEGRRRRSARAWRARWPS